MNLIVNGEAKSVQSDSVSVTDLLKVLSVEMSLYVSVQLNGEFVQRADFDTVFVKDQDEVDFLYFMGGGCGQAGLFPSVSDYAPEGFHGKNKNGKQNR